ncbi:MAG: VWA domain-containing protein, partial [Anaerolineales bacterium]
LDGAGMRRVILLTDGDPTVTTPEAVLKQARRAARAQIIIDTIGLGRPGQRDYNEILLKQIAEMTGGRFRHVDALAALDASFEALATEKRFLLTD